MFKNIIKKCKSLFVGATVVAVGVVVSAGNAIAAYTLDLGTTTTDMATIGGVILAALGLLAGFGLIVKMVRKAG